MKPTPSINNPFGGGRYEASAKLPSAQSPKPIPALSTSIGETDLSDFFKGQHKNVKQAAQ
ncbi:MAG: hypothetical protein JOZ14_08325 [Acidobacteria bacterium]|nr:hypothetical protein [Acidobacteriota bacterium]